MNLPTSGLLRAIARDRRGLAVTEMAYCLPILLLLTLWLFEITNYVIVKQQVSQLAIQVADNASRIGTQNTVQSEIDEGQVNDLFIGAGLQSGRLDILRNGRIILSSLEVDPASPNGQYIHWQRCYGTLAYPSSYGVQGDGKGNTNVKGMGPASARITATATAPAMYVEIGYNYRPMITSAWIPSGPIKEVASLIVRDNRDTSGTGIKAVAGTTPSTC
ncbi:MAG: pilus assembly protein [Sphingomonadaceae bacterium]|nr:pilus assembly protein [Sphingomonadaceae bacterium]